MYLKHKVIRVLTHPCVNALGITWPDRGSQKVVFISENLCIFRNPSDIMVARLQSIVCSIYKQTDGRTNVILVSAFGCYYSRTSYY